jgi:hypothetical protein
MLLFLIRANATQLQAMGCRNSAMNTCVFEGLQASVYVTATLPWGSLECQRSKTATATGMVLIVEDPKPNLYHSHLVAGRIIWQE